MPLELELKKLGFSDKEARVYLALLELGSAAVQDIAAKAKVNRATTYVVLETLKRRGVVSTVEKKNKILFAAENPSVLLRIFRTQEEEIRTKENEFSKILPELDALFSGSRDRPRVRFFEGSEGREAVREDLLSSGAKEVLAIYSFDEVKNLFPLEQTKAFIKKRDELGIKIRAIYTSADGPFGGFVSSGERRFVPKDKFPFSADISIYSSRVALTTLRGQSMTAIIEEPEIANTMRLVFELAWLGADHV
ncbi:MAG: Transcriptional regulator, TrmB [Parcubacteria group bacterium GW2011_GWB1_52_7]|nr:MAG: Transcriptional regulator, TrmB [Parcubacteria group bacterium GW2011_GWA1_51_12]KKW29197.1 MAG: Transcriptional regulator, TrmB [Parcubacteria group bacterium GW2011_GWB1_52_7]KKW31026.1 MAG: Transcriptional regulator, TrmB [Parcubacteria group bacterium GW2011_GWC2_52_8c]